jgi:type IV secretion system protein VirB4
VVCELNLRGFEYELNVISGRIANIEIINRVIADVGHDPAVWLPRFRDATGKGAAARAASLNVSKARVAVG